MAALKLFLKDEIDDLKNQIESDNTGIDEFDLNLIFFTGANTIIKRGK